MTVYNSDMMQRDTPFLGSLTMNPRHNEIAPLNTSSVNSTRFPSPPSNGGGGSGVRGGTPRPRGRRSLSRILPHPQTPLTHRPPMGLRPMHQPFSFGSQPPMSPAPSWLPCYRRAPVVNYTEALARIVFRWNAQRRRNGDNVNGLSSPMTPQSSADGMIHPRPIQMPVGVMTYEGLGENESHGHGEEVLLTDYMDPDKIFYVYNEDDLEIIFGDSENVKSSSGSENSSLSVYESPNLPYGNENALSDPNHAKRILANPESSARSNAKRVRRVQELEEKVSALERELGVSTGNSKLNERSLSVLEDENKQLRIGANGLQEQLSRPNALDEQLTVEDHQPELASGELMFDISEYMSNWEPLDLNMFQTYNPSLLDEQPQTNLDFNEHII